MVKTSLVSIIYAAGAFVTLIGPAASGSEKPAAGDPSEAGIYLKAFAPDAYETEALAANIFQNRSARELSAKYIVPDSPAFYILGVSGDGAIQAKSPREFAVGVLNGLNKDGHLQNGIAIEWAPFAKALTQGADARYQVFKTDPPAKALSRFALSFATVHGESDPDKSLRMAFGVRATIFDNSDTRTSETTQNVFIARSKRIIARYRQRAELLTGTKDSGANGLIDLLTAQADCLAPLDKADNLIEVSAVRRCFDLTSPTLSKRADLPALLDELQVCDQPSNLAVGTRRLNKSEIQALEECKRAQIIALRMELTSLRGELIDEIESDENLKLSVQNAGGDIWNKSAWSVGIAPVWISRDGKSDHLRPAGFGAYTAASYGFGKWLQIVASGLFRSKDLVKDPTDDTKKIEQDTTLAALELRFGDPGEGDARREPGFIFSASANYNHADRKTMADDEHWIFAAGADIRIDEGLALKLSIGGETKQRDGGGNTFVLGKLKWGFQ